MPTAVEQQEQRRWALALEAQRTANAAKSRETRDPMLWIESVWTIRGDPNKPWRGEGWLFLEEPIMCDDKEVVIMAGSGVGKTEIYIPWALAQADWGEGVIYCFESGKKTSHIVQERVNPNFKSNNYLIKRNRGEVDNVELKKLGKGYVYFLGMGSDAVTRTYHGSTLILDELDAMDAARVSDMWGRLGSAPKPRRRDLGNPKSPDHGIHKRYKAGDQRRWHITCDHCKHEAPLHFNTHVDKEKAITLCPSCKKPIDRLKPGRWIPMNPGAPYRSYHMHRLMAKVCDIQSLIDMSRNPDARVQSTFFRMELGEPYAEKTGGLTQEDLDRIGGGPEFTQYAPGGFLVCDPGSLFDIQIYKELKAGEAARCVWVGTVKDFDELAALIEVSKVTGGLIDWGPEQKGAEKFCRQQFALGRDFKRVAYRLPDTAGTPEWMFDDEDEFLLLACRTAICDRMVENIRTRKMLFPTRVISNEESRFCQHMKSPLRVVEFDRHGIEKVSWQHDETNRDDQFHCAVYASIYIQQITESSGDNSGVGQEGD